MPIKRGWSRQIVAENIAQLQREGKTRDQAIVISMNSGRKYYFKEFPKVGEQLPPHLTLKKHGKTKEYFRPTGAPIFRQGNPVRELDIPESEMRAIRQGVKKQLTGRGADVRKAANLYTEFTGHDDPNLTKLTVPSMPKVALEVGLCDGLLYTTVRDNVTEKYIHKFKSKSRPLLAASPDGKILLLLGGAFNFTDRGIVDK